MFQVGYVAVAVWADVVDGVVVVRVECGKFCQRMWVRRVKGRIQQKGRGEKMGQEERRRLEGEQLMVRCQLGSGECLRRR